MSPRLHKSTVANAFTLIELLVVVAIIGILAAIILPVFARTKQQANEVKTMSNMKQMGIAFLSYANDNNYQFPNRAVGGSDPTVPAPQKWPSLMSQYIPNLDVYSSPIPDVLGKGTYKVANQSDFLRNDYNFTSYIYNGMNEVITYGNATSTIRLNSISLPTETILLGIPFPQQNQFYMDFEERNNVDILNKTAFSVGTIYLFCDGSSRMLVNNADSVTYQTSKPPSSGTYTDWLWLIDKTKATVSIH